MGAIPFEPNQDGSTQGGELVYVGEVGTAFSRRMSTELRKLLEAIVAKKPTVN
jgi:ATP-dependent DNA ligase